MDVREKLHPLLYVFAAVHAGIGAWVLWSAVAASFGGVWMFAALGGPLLLANAIGATLRREEIDRKISRGIAMTLRVGGGFALMVGALAMREDMDSAWTVMGVALGVALWGVAYGWVIDASTFAAPRRP